MPKLTGLLLGAGASYEVGMPLVWDITSEFKTTFRPERLREYNRGWRSHGGGYPDAAIEDLAAALERNDMHYEAVLGHLETEFRRPGSPPELHQAYHGLYVWLVEMVYHVLYFRHVNNAQHIERSVRYLDGIAGLAAQNAPLWVFSLNHDVVVECVAAHHNLPVSYGFDGSVTLPRRGSSGEKLGELQAEVITADSLERLGMRFLQPGARGINLIKVHGGLDVFAFRDGKDLLRILPIGSGVQGVLDALRATNEELVFHEPGATGRPPLKVWNEIAFADHAGQCQFLRRSLLAGAFKFNSRSSQVLPQRLLTYFRSHLNNVSTLLCVGYSFGDDHINMAIREWLEFSSERRIEIVRPDATMPPSLLHVATQVSLTRSGAAEFFDAQGGVSRTRRERLEKQVADWGRKRGAEARTAFMEFVAGHIDSRRKALFEKLAELPFRDGDVDLQALGVTKDEFFERWLKEGRLSIEDALEAFLDSQKTS